MAYSSDKHCITRIVDYCEEIGEFTNNYSCTLEELYSKKNDFYAVSFAIMQIGELVKHLTDDFLSKTKEHIPWKQIRAMRNFFAHGYDDMEPLTIWETATNDIPELKHFCEEYLKENLI
jgi:uncharacterized protein with HEPN domain